MTATKDANPKTRILLALHSYAYGNVLKELAILLKRSKKYDPVFFIVNIQTIHLMNLKELFTEQIICLGPNGRQIRENKNAGSDPPIIQITEKRHNYAYDQFIKSFPYITKPLAKFFFVIRREVKTILSIGYHFWHLANLISLVRKLIQTWKITILAVGAETQFYGTPAVIRAARMENIPVINAVMFFAPEGGEVPESLVSWPMHSQRYWLNKIVGYIFPRWVGTYNQSSFLYLPGPEVLAHELLKLSDPKPLAGESDFSDVVLIQCNKIREYALSNGHSSEKLEVTGEPIYDEMAITLNNAEYLREKLYQRLCLHPAKPLILSGLAPDRISGREARISGWEFRSYMELVRFWIESLNTVSDYNVILTIHPTQRQRNIPFLEDCGIKICDEKTSNLIPLCDIFITDGVSSTIPWAIACGKPVIEYDTYRWRLSRYSEDSGVVRVENKNEYLSTLNRLTSDSRYYTQLANSQRSVAKQWGSLDGKSGERILSVFDKLSNRKQYQRSINS